MSDSDPDPTTQPERSAPIQDEAGDVTDPPRAEAGEATDEDARPSPEPLDIESLAEADPRSKAELLSELLEAEASRDEYLDDLRRAHADFENYRKRVMREGATQRAAGKAEVASAMLEVLDDLDRTVAAARDSQDRSIAKGVELVATKLQEALGGTGLERIDATGITFDPTEHEAVQQQPSDEDREEPVVAEVLRPGYRMGERVLRAAMVVVEQ